MCNIDEEALQELLNSDSIDTLVAEAISDYPAHKNGIDAVKVNKTFLRDLAVLALHGDVESDLLVGRLISNAIRDYLGLAIKHNRKG